MSEEMIGKYRLLEKRGEGGFGILYKAMDTLIERVVALKVLHAQYASNERLSSWFMREAKAMARLNHPNIVTIHNFEIEGDRHFIVMEFVEGSSLDEELEARGPLSIHDTVKIALQMIDGFGYAHEKGIIHRDIKPSNVMIDASRKVKITDFGIAKILDDTRLTRTGTGAGSLHYMSPEQIEGKAIDARTDIYSLGITLYQMLTGKVPFTDESEFVVMRAHLDQPPVCPSQLRPDVPEDLERIVLRMLEKKPGDRYDSMKALGEELEGRQSKPRQTYGPTIDARPTGDRIQPAEDHGERTTPRDRIDGVAEAKARRWSVGKIGLVIGAVLVLVVAAVISLQTIFKDGQVTSDDLAMIDSTAVESHDSAADDGQISGNDVQSGDTALFAAAETTAIVPVYNGKLVIDISPFDFREKPTVVFRGERMTVEDIPFEITGIKSGSYEISVHYGDKSFFDNVSVDNDTQLREYKFNGPTGRVSVGAEFIGRQQQPWAEIVIDGVPLEQGTPASCDLVEGPHKILVRKDGYELIGKPKFVRVKAGENTTVSFKLRPK